MGQKVAEFRQLKPHWYRHLSEENTQMDDPQARAQVPRKYDEIHFRNGYNPDAPFMRVEFLDFVVMRYPPWRSLQKVFALRLGKILEIQNWTCPKTSQQSPAKPSHPLRGSASKNSPG
jgi:hypothetical protein